MSNLSNGWIQVPLRSLLSPNEKFRDINDDEDCGFVPMNLVPTKLLGKIQYEQKKWGDCKNGYTHFKDGDVLLAKITPCFENGKSVLVSGLPNGLGAGSTEYFVLRSESLDSRYLHAFVKTKQFKDDCTVRMTGSVGHKRVPKDYLLDYPIPIPPLNEQIRIANKLDSVLAKVDAAQARLEKIPTLLKRFRQSVLAAATSGELTREWRETSSKSIQAWKTTSIGQLIKTGPQNGIYKPSTLYGTGTKIVRIDGFYDGQLKSQQSLKRVAITEAERFTWGLREGDVLINRVNSIEYLGKCGIVESLTEPTVFESNIMRITLNEHVIPKFLTTFLTSPIGRSRITENAKHAVNQASINQTDVKGCVLELPLLEEQKEIVRRVESLFALADTVEKQYLAAKQRTDRLTQSLLAKAFRGELVPQDPNDELAADLLKRIQAERNTQPPAKNKRSKPA